MSTIWGIASSFPTIIFTSIIVILLCYWLLVVLGLMDIELFDIDVDTEMDTDVDMSTILTFMTTLGLTGVPIMIVISIMSFVSFIICYTAVKFGLFWTENESIIWLIGSAIALVSFLCAIPITAQLIKPLKGFFAQLKGDNGAKNLLARTCKIRSTKVTDSFGEAECIMDGASLIIKVRAPEKYAFKKGDTAYIIEFDNLNNIYHVVDEHDFNLTLNQ